MNREITSTQDDQLIDIDVDHFSLPIANTMKVLVMLHWFESVAQCTALVVAAFALGFELPYGSLWLIVLLFAVWNTGTTYFLRRERLQNSEFQVLLQLGVEIVTLTGLLYFTGGATNPFVSLYLVPIALGAIVLPRRMAIAVMLCAMTCYTVLMFHFEPLVDQHVGHSNGFGLHVLGMWVNFLISAVVCVVALSFLAALARSRAERIMQLRERIIQDNRVTALGGMAAATAHSLSTPLSTVAVVLDGLESELNPESAHTGSLIKTAREQIDVCRDRLSAMLDRNHAERMSDAKVESVQQVLSRVLLEWQLLHPLVEVHVSQQTNQSVLVGATIDFCLTTVLDNAAEASTENGSSKIMVRSRQQDHEILIEIEDEGGGPIPEQTLTTTKAHGAGVGLTIARANLVRSGCKLNFEMGAKGCVAILSLPVLDLTPGSRS